MCGFAGTLSPSRHAPIDRELIRAMGDWGPGADGFYCGEGIARLWNEHQQGRRDQCPRLWSLVMIGLWFREFADGARRAAAA
jgi:hypothetical protein